MSDAITIIASSLLAMAVLLFLVARLLRRNPAVKHEEFQEIVKSEFARAKRLKKLVALIRIDMDPGVNVDLVTQLTIDRTLIRDYDHVVMLTQNRYCIVWPDNEADITINAVKKQVSIRLQGIRGIKHVGVAIFPEQGEDYQKLLELAESAA